MRPALGRIMPSFYLVTAMKRKSVSALSNDDYAIKPVNVRKYLSVIYMCLRHIRTCKHAV